jgi:hypothetical protein
MALNYSAVGIANMSLQRIGARGTIASLTENSPNAIKVNTVWSMILAEVLSERDWKFAKTRIQLEQNANMPVGGYKFAYSLPADFLRLVKPREKPEERRIATWYSGWGGYEGGWGNRNRDYPVWPREVDPYITETVADTSTPPNYSNNLLTNYPYCNTYPSPCPITINYIRLITDLTQLLPGFVNALAFRLAAEVAVAITESPKKAEDMMGMYMAALNGAQAQTECDDYLKNEAGGDEWVTAGRYWGRGYR